MITYGISLQDRAHAVPEEVAVWLLERNALYPAIEFKIERFDSESQEYARRYSRIYAVKPSGIDQVTFPYLAETWVVRIIGASDGNGNIVDLDTWVKGQPRDALGKELRAEISGVPLAEELEGIGDSAYGLPRGSDAPVEDRPSNLVKVSADIFWKSDFQISGAELADLFQGQSTDRKTEILRALSEKDYDKAKKLLEQRS
jgi:hypothetical protein